jgi:5-methylcytosine-specific restriction endonuclease McrA
MNTHYAKGLCRPCYKVAHQKAKGYEQTDKSKERRKRYSQIYYAKRREHIIERVKRYRVANWDAIYASRKQSDKRRLYMEQYRAKNQPRASEQAKERRRLNPAIHKRHKQTRRARIRNLPATLTVQDWAAILEASGHACAYCGATNVPLHQEHKTPVARGGGYTADNIVPACQPCNQHKGTKTDQEYREYLDAQHRITPNP